MIIERLLEKRAKKVKVDIGDGAHYEYDDTDPYGAEDAKWMQYLRRPKGVIRAAFSSKLAPFAFPAAALLASATWPKLTEFAGIKQTTPTEKFIGSTAAGTLALAGALLGSTAMNYGKRDSVEDALKALEAIRKSRKAAPSIYNMNKKLISA